MTTRRKDTARPGPGRELGDSQAETRIAAAQVRDPRRTRRTRTGPIGRASVGVVGLWDRLRIKQIVAALISNAVRYSGGGCVELALNASTDRAELSVRDHGPGLDAEVLSQLGAPFNPRNEPVYDRAHRGGGFGLGLWIVQALCTAMDGSIAAENIATGGVILRVVLPRGGSSSET